MISKTAHQLIISPHCDDALLAMGGTILLAKDPVDVVTIFGTCAWTTLPDLFKPEDITRVNQDEDRRALTAAGCHLTLYEYPEALLRGYRKWNAKRPHPADKSLSQKIKQTLRDHLKGLREVYFPIAPGSHIDHMTIAKLVDGLYKELAPRGLRFFVFEDLPYSWYGGLDERFADLRKRYTLTPSVVDITKVVDKKVELLKYYKTQLAQSDIDKVMSYAQTLVTKGFGERTWELTKP